MNTKIKISFAKRQKGAVEILCIVCALFFMAAGCAKQDSSNLEEGENPYFYYYEGKKIFIQQVKDKVLLKFTPDAGKEQLQILIDSNASLQPTSDTFLEGGSLRFAVLESKDGKNIPSAAIESFKANPVVVSANYLFQVDKGKLQGLMDEFVVKLKEMTTHEQLKMLAKQNNCVVGEENQLFKNQFTLFVPKTSDLNAMRMSNLFYETGLFEFSVPNMILFNAFDF